MTDQEEATALLDARVQVLNDLFEGRNGMPMAYMRMADGKSERMVVYEMLTSGGIKEQAKAPPRQYGYPTAKEAADAWIRESAILEGQKGILYWRRRPMLGLGGDDGESPPLWRVSSRQAIIDGKPDLTFPEDWEESERVGWDKMVADYSAQSIVLDETSTLEKDPKGGWHRVPHPA